MMRESSQILEVSLVKRSSAKPKIVIIEDDSDLVGLLTLHLEEAGFSVRGANDGEAGLEKVRSFEPDIILLDLLMPRLNGWDVCRMLRKDPLLKGIPVIVMVSLLETGLLKDLQEFDIAHLLLKPFDVKSLVDLLKKTVN
jgi:DNA-binding response OmpR family regulator